MRMSSSASASDRRELPEFSAECPEAFARLASSTSAQRMPGGWKILSSSTPCGNATAGRCWKEWPRALARREAAALATARKELAAEMDLRRVTPVLLLRTMARAAAAMRAALHPRGGRYRDLRGLRQRRRVGASRPFSPAGRSRAGSGLRRSARRFQRHRPALGHSSL